jgi:MHS family proline/betaine transporter-like MFS transporter
MCSVLATQLFPASDRYSGVAFGVSVGEAIFGGTAPLIAMGLVLITGVTIAPAFYLIFCSFIGLGAVNFYKPVSFGKFVNTP